jgi:uncharacterized protein (TIGR03382 family)
MDYRGNLEGLMKKSIVETLIRIGTRALAFASVLALSTACASAGPLTWNLFGVTFSDGATATGYFTYDATGGPNTLGAYDIVVSGSVYVGSYEYDTGDSSPFDITSTGVTVENFGIEFYLTLIPEAPMTDAGGTINLDTENSFDCWKLPNGGNPCGVLAGGEITTTSAPEPGPILLSAAGVLILSWLFFRRRRSDAGSSLERA